MNNDTQGKGIVFSVTVEDFQDEAIHRIGRKLNDDELYTAGKCIDWGLSSGIEIVFKSAIEEAVERNTQATVS